MSGTGTVVADQEMVVALVGNPNVGKSTIFNALTRSRQHTGNWPGKTVEVVQGNYAYKGKKYTLIDLPGTYSLISRSEEEEITAEYLLSGSANCIVFLADATCLSRSLILALQAMEFTDRAVMCVNLMDEAQRNGVSVDLDELQLQLGIPVVGTSASSGEGLDRLREVIRNMADGFLTNTNAGRCSGGGQKDASLGETCAEYVNRAEKISKTVISGECRKPDSVLDKVTLGPVAGRIVLIALLFVIFWLTITGANYPGKFLEMLFDRFGEILRRALLTCPDWIRGLLVDGVYDTAATVVAVMLPPMAIFFPLFSLLEDFGYLTRAAFLMDHRFERCGSCGKQALTMAMGFGCNAVGVTGCRIIESKKVRMIAMLTNAFVPCNGRFPALLALAALITPHNGFGETLLVTGFVLLGVVLTFVASSFLSKMIRKEEETEDFLMEMPPYRRPKVLAVLYRSIKDRILVVLGRAVSVAAPAGAVLWVMKNIYMGDLVLIDYIASLLDPIGNALGVNGIVLTALILSFPANELFLPLVTTMSNANLSELDWGASMVICTMVLVLLHWPCSTTFLTVRKEAGGWRWALAALILPAAFGIIICILINSL